MFDFRKVERDTLNFWQKNKIFEKSLENRRKAKRFIFWEGPPTANGRPGIHHSLARAFKDLYCRYKTMRGFYVLRRAGWDTHGLPVELEVEKELGFKNKKDIEKYGIAKFNKKAKESVWKYKAEWEEVTRRMGYWLDMDHPYITYENKYIESLWAIIKKIWDKKLLYFAHRVVHFCTRCGTPLSSHEVAQGYKTVTDRAITVKFLISNPELLNKSKIQNPKSKIKGSPLATTYILAWTTTPWTLPGNVALAVGKSIKYQVVSIKDKDEKYILAEDLVSRVLNTEYIIHDTILGSDLVGLEYEPLFNVEKLKSEKSYRIYPADFVSTEEGTGVVHTAVMYGEDDYELGTKIGLPKFHTVDERGRFVGVSKELDGRYVKDPETEKLVIRELEIRNLLFKIEDFEHDYPFCWRCDTPLTYYAKESWFIKMSAVNKQLLKNNQKINWIPEHIKEGRFGQWLKEGKDWAFSRERYWGTPLPVWHCQTGKNQKSTFVPSSGRGKIKNQNFGDDHYLVIGSLEDLEKYRYKPKNEYYVLRHGHSTKNKDERTENIISSKLENDKYHLTEEGKKQIHEVAKKLKKMSGIDLIISSPFLRTRETAQIIAEELGKKIQIDDRITEFQHGSLCEGKTEHLCEIHHGNNGWETKTGDGESWKELKIRMSQFLVDIDSKHNGKKILIVSHGDPIWLLESFTLGLAGDSAIKIRNEIYPDKGELRKLDLKNWPFDENGELDLHRPYIDRIELKCSECGGKMIKVPDLIDVWFDSGAMPYASQTDFPADFIAEAVDQTRGWFYTLLAVSTLLGKGAPYKNVISLAHVLDEKGQKMSKSKGNIVLPLEVMDKFGADAVRWYFYTINSPGDYKLFSSKDVEQKFKGFITTLDNCVRFWELYVGSHDKMYAKSDKQESRAYSQQPKTLSLLDEWILSRLNGLVSEVTENLDKYDPTTASRAVERFVVDDFSNWWLRRSRKREEALELLRFVLFELSKIIAPFIPFIAENIWHRLQDNRQLTNTNYQLLISVHLHDWPKANRKFVDGELEKEMNKIRKIVTVGLALRKEKQIKVRQPLAKLTIGSLRPTAHNLQLIDLIKEELNVKEVAYNKNQKEEVILDTKLSQSLIYEGYARELMRQIQDMRKEAGYRLDERIFGQWHSDDKEISEAIRQWSDEIKKEVLLSEFLNSRHDEKAYDIEKEFELVPQKKIWMSIRR